MRLISSNALQWIVILVALTGLSSCANYNQNIMFQTEESEFDSIKAQKERAKENYKLRKGDYFTYRVYTNEGELLIDPNYSLREDMPRRRNNQNNQQQRQYLVRQSGKAYLPMIGDVELQGLTVYQVDTLLANKYNKFYKECYVKTQVQNKRVFVLGGQQGGQVIPLENENMTLIEVLALYGGVDERSRAHNIRLIRGDLNNPRVEVVDLSTINGMKEANLRVYSNDIIYIETVQKAFKEAVRDVSPIISVMSNLITLAVLISSL